MLPDDAGVVSVEYAITALAAAAFAGLLILIISSDTVRAGLTDLIESALSVRL
jgi:hypothetical protein